VNPAALKLGEAWGRDLRSAAATVDRETGDGLEALAVLFEMTITNLCELHGPTFAEEFRMSALREISKQFPDLERMLVDGARDARRYGLDRRNG
jgi:hypothetical protein